MREWCSNEICVGKEGNFPFRLVPIPPFSSFPSSSIYYKHRKPTRFGANCHAVQWSEVLNTAKWTKSHSVQRERNWNKRYENSMEEWRDAVTSQGESQAAEVEAREREEKESLRNMKWSYVSYEVLTTAELNTWASFATSAPCTTLPPLPPPPKKYKQNKRNKQTMLFMPALPCLTPS